MEIKYKTVNVMDIMYLLLAFITHNLNKYGNKIQF